MQATLTKLLRGLVIRQEGAYSDANAYTTDLAKLRVEVPDGVRVSIVDANTRGWFGIALDTRTRVTCAMGVGYGVIGWSEAVPQCSR